MHLYYFANIEEMVSGDLLEVHGIDAPNEDIELLLMKPPAPKNVTRMLAKSHTIDFETNMVVELHLELNELSRN
jgi:hypothetical protein